MSRKRWEPEPDASELWRAHREAQRERLAERVPAAREAILGLRAKGYTVAELNAGYQFRVNGAVDLFPVHRRWHDLRRNARGGYGPNPGDVERTIERLMKRSSAEPRL